MNFKKLLFLSYLYQKESTYSLFEIQYILGFSYSQFYDIMDELLAEKKIIYENNLLQITSKGIINVISNNMENYPFDTDDAEIDTFVSRSKQDIYIPKG